MKWRRTASINFETLAAKKKKEKKGKIEALNPTCQVCNFHRIAIVRTSGLLPMNLRGRVIYTIIAEKWIGIISSCGRRPSIWMCFPARFKYWICFQIRLKPCGTRATQFAKLSEDNSLLLLRCALSSFRSRFTVTIKNECENVVRAVKGTYTAQ